MCIIPISAVYPPASGKCPYGDRCWRDRHQWWPLCHGTSYRMDSRRTARNHGHSSVDSERRASTVFDPDRTFHNWNWWRVNCAEYINVVELNENSLWMIQKIWYLVDCLPITERHAIERSRFTQANAFVFAFQFGGCGQHFFHSRWEQFGRWTVAQVTNCQINDRHAINLFLFIRSNRMWLTFFVFFIGDRLNFASVSVAGAFVHLECIVLD